MVDEVKDQPEEQKPESQEIKIEINYSFVNGTSVKGFTGNKAIDYGILECAKDAVRNFHEARMINEAQKIVKPNKNGILNFARGIK